MLEKMSLCIHSLSGSWAGISSIMSGAWCQEASAAAPVFRKKQLFEREVFRGGSGGANQGEELLSGLGVFEEDSANGAGDDRNSGLLEPSHGEA